MDIVVKDCGTVTMLVAQNTRAAEWSSVECCTEPWQWSGPALAVEPRCVEEILDGAIGAGFEVEVQ